MVSYSQLRKECLAYRVLGNLFGGIENFYRTVGIMLFDESLNSREYRRH